MITTAVIPVAGLGTRMLPYTKEQPKAMLPLFVGNLVKPTLQIIFEQLYKAGIRKFIFIVSRGKRAIEDHFTPDYTFLDSLRKRGKNQSIRELSSFYKKIESSTLLWLNQSLPLGLGHALLISRTSIQDHRFLVHAGDTVLTAPFEINKMLEICNNPNLKDVSRICVRRVSDKHLLKRYGIAEINSHFLITRVVEKPTHPTSDFAIVPIYVLTQKIFEILKRLPQDDSSEIQFTQAINHLIESGLTVQAYDIGEIRRIDVGSPDTYHDALSYSFKI